MAFRGAGISIRSDKVSAKSTFSNGFGYNLVYTPSTPASQCADVFFQFGTEQKSCTTFNIMVTVEVVKKYADASGNQLASFVEVAKAGSWISPTQGAIPASAFAVSGELGAYTYSISFKDAAYMKCGGTSLFNYLCNSTMAFANRKFDCVRLKFELGGFYNGGHVHTKAECYIGYNPELVPSGAKVTDDGLSLVFSEPGWMRPNDRWQVDKDIVVGGKVLVKKGVWGKACIWESSTECALLIPKSSLQFTPWSGAQITAGRVRLAGSWQPQTGTSSIGYVTYPGSSSAGYTIVNNLQAKTGDTGAGGTAGNPVVLWTPTLSVSRSGSNVKATVGEAQSGGNTRLGYIEVQMVGGTSAFDTATLAPGESHVFHGVPFGVQTTWEATGYRDMGTSDDPDIYQGKTVSKTLAAIPPRDPGQGTVFVNESGSTVNVVYNLDVSRVSKPEYETVKFAGRSRPSVAYGEGGEVAWTFEGDVFTSTPPGRPDAVVTPELDLVEMPMNGPWLLRDEAGNRYVLNVTQVAVTREYGAVHWRHVSISAEEVA